MRVLQIECQERERERERERKRAQLVAAQVDMYFCLPSICFGASKGALARSLFRRGAGSACEAI